MKGNVVSGYRHRAGIHCGSTAMKNLLNFNGRDYPEEDLFGLGEGLGFIYVDHQEVPPHVAIHGRTLDLERVLAARVDVGYEERVFDDPDELWGFCLDMMGRGVPLLAEADIRFLDYFSSSTHFSGHRVVLAGFEGEEVAYVSDSEFEGLNTIPVSSLKVAMSSTVPPFTTANLVSFLSGAPEVPGPDRYLEAIVNCSRKMVFPADPYSGIPGMLRAYQEIPRWHELSPTPDFAARFSYQVIEKRGTGGGFFRNLYSRFLINAGSGVKEVGAWDLAREMEEIAGFWTGFALFMKGLSENCTPSGFREGADIFGRLMDLEESYHRKVLTIFT